MKRAFFPLMSLAMAFGALAVPAADGPAVGPEFEVNTYTVNIQEQPRVAARPDGNFVVVWTSDGSSGSDGSSQSVQGQRFLADGNPEGSEFQVNTYTVFSQSRPDVAYAADGRFVVVWDSNGSLGSDSDGYSVQAQRYLADGTPDGSEFQVNSFTPSDQRLPKVASAPDGRFAVVWASEESAGSDSSSFSIQLRRFAADGTPVGPDQQVNTYTTESQSSPTVSVASDGDFIVGWESLGSPGSDSDGESIQSRRYAADGTPAGPQFQVNTLTSGPQERPHLVHLAGGGFVVSWHGDSFGNDFSPPSIQARVADANGMPINTEFQVNTQTSGSQVDPRLAATPDGGFIVTWRSDSSSGSDNSLSSIQHRRFLEDGTPASAEFQVNTWTTFHQRHPSVAASSNGDFVVVWESDDSAGDFLGSILAQRFSLNIFSDGFESGDTSAWTVVVP